MEGICSKQPSKEYEKSAEYINGAVIARLCLQDDRALNELQSKH